MNSPTVRIDHVHYNAASQSFEATVTVYGRHLARKFACSINAPITMSFEDAASGLAKQATRRFEKRQGLRSTLIASAPKHRAGRNGFDPVTWLQGLLGRPDHKAA